MRDHDLYDYDDNSREDAREDARQDAYDDEGAPRRKHSAGRCSDMMCGASDCSTCYPSSWDDANEWICGECHEAVVDEEGMSCAPCAGEVDGE